MTSPTDIFSRALGLPVSVREQAGFHVVLGPQDMCSRALEALCPLLTGPARVLWVDAANRFDAHGLARAAVARGMNPMAVLGRIQLARPFNAFQLAALTERIPPGIPLVWADPLCLFYDQDLALDDARPVFERFRRKVSARPGPTLALLVERDAPPGRWDFADRLLARSASVVRLVCKGGI